MFGNAQFGTTIFGESPAEVGEAITLSGLCAAMTSGTTSHQIERQLSSLSVCQPLPNGNSLIVRRQRGWNQTIEADQVIIRRSILPSAQIFGIPQERTSLQRRTSIAGRLPSDQTCSVTLHPQRLFESREESLATGRISINRCGVLSTTAAQVHETVSVVEVFLSIESITEQPLQARLTFGGLQLSAICTQGISNLGRMIQVKGLIVSGSTEIRATSHPRIVRQLALTVGLIEYEVTTLGRSAICRVFVEESNQTTVRIGLTSRTGFQTLERSVTRTELQKELRLHLEHHEAAAGKATLRFLHRLSAVDSQGIVVSGLLNRPTTLATTEPQLTMIFGRFAIIPDTSNDRLVVVFAERRTVVVPKQNEV